MNEPSLFFRDTGSGDPIIILHGVFGSSDNWMTIARYLEASNKVYLLDLRNHGQSFHSDDFDYKVMVEDLKDFIGKQQISNPIILGHSMGGKVAMNFAIAHSDILKKLIIVDIAPRSYPIHHENILNGLSSIDLENLKSRNDADEQLAKYESDIGVRNFLLKNLTRNDNGAFEWKLNLPVIRMKIERVGMGLLYEGKFDKETLFIKGSFSNYIGDDDKESIESYFPNSTIATIEGAGHWVHAEKPEQFIKMVKEFIDS